MNAILVIKHGALGDIILATSAFAAIRQYHPGQPIILLTNQRYVGLAKLMPYFDHVWVDDRPKIWRLWAYCSALRKLSGRGPILLKVARIYDLQMSERTRWYYHFLRRKPEWFGVAPGCSHPRLFKSGQFHVLDSYVKHFNSYRIPIKTHPDVTWLQAPLSSQSLPSVYVLLIPSCSFKHQQKRWTSSGYARLVVALAKQNIDVVVVGAETDRPIIEPIKKLLPHGVEMHDWVGRSSMPVLASLARQAMAVVGVDTGPMHCAAATGTPSLVLFSSSSPSPSRLWSPRGDHVRVILKGDLKQLGSTEVVQAVLSLLGLAVE